MSEPILTGGEMLVQQNLTLLSEKQTLLQRNIALIADKEELLLRNADLLRSNQDLQVLIDQLQLRIDQLNQEYNYFKSKKTKLISIKVFIYVLVNIFSFFLFIVFLNYFTQYEIKCVAVTNNL